MLGKAGTVEELFDLFDGFLKDKINLATGWQIIKEGKMPEGWKQKPAKNRRKDKDARTKKH